MKKSIASIMCVLSFVAFAAPTVSYQTATNIAKKVIDQTLTYALDGKRDMSDLAVYSVTRTENTDWTWTADNAELEAALSGKKPVFDEGYWWHPNVEGFRPHDPVKERSRDATEIVCTYEPESGDPGVYTATASRPRYMDETLGPEKQDQQLAAVATDDTTKPANGDLVKYDAVNDRFIKATASDAPFSSDGDYVKPEILNSVADIANTAYETASRASADSELALIRIGNLSVAKQDALPYPTNAIPANAIYDFSNAVLAVQIDTNTVAQIGELKEFFDDLPTGTAATSLGGIVLALLGAAAYLKKKTAHLESDGTATDYFATDLLGKQVAISAMHYAIGTAITASTKLADRTTNFVNALSTLTDPIDLTFPDLVTGKCRDFLVRVHRETGGVAVSFTAPTSAVIYGDGFSTAIGEGEDWLFAITETAANEWYVRAIKLEVAA